MKWASCRLVAFISLHKYSSFLVLLNNHFYCFLFVVQVADLVIPLRELAHTDANVAYHMWVLVFPIAWATLQKEEQEKHRSSSFLHTFCMGGTFNIVYMFDFKKGLWIIWFCVSRMGETYIRYLLSWTSEVHREPSCTLQTMRFEHLSSLIRLSRWYNKHLGTKWRQKYVIVNEQP